MNRNFFSLLMITLLATGYTMGQTIIVDPITYEIKIIDEETGDELNPNNLGTEESTSKTNNTNTEATKDTEKKEENAIEEDVTSPTSTGSEYTNNNEYQQGTNEFDNALDRMYQKGLTIFEETEAYQPNNVLTREQFAKMINRFYKVLDYPNETKNTKCNFFDLTQADPTLQEHIEETCRLGIFKGYSNNTFRPFQQLTIAEFTTVIMRIYQQKSLDETGFPRRVEYYNLAKEKNIIQELDRDQMEQKITRKQTAIYIRRLKNLIEKELGITTDTNQETIGKQDTSSILKNISILGEEINPQNDPQLKEAIHTMYENKMIQTDSINNNFLFAYATRDELAKILDIFGDTYIEDYPSRKENKQAACTFKDINSTHTNYIYINNLCKMGIMLGDNENNFLPKQPMLKAQFITALVRLIEGKLNENIEPRRQNYFEKAEERGIISNDDKQSFEREITNIEVILYLHRLIINNIIAKNLDMVSDPNEFMSVTKYNDQNKVYINVNFLRTLDNKVGYLNREGTKRKIQKTHIQEYPNFHITRYGEVRDTISNEILGSVMFITDRKKLLYGNIRFIKENVLYTIQPDEKIDNEYLITQQTRQ